MRSNGRAFRTAQGIDKRKRASSQCRAQKETGKAKIKHRRYLPYRYGLEPGTSPVGYYGQTLHLTPISSLSSMWMHARSTVTMALSTKYGIRVIVTESSPPNTLRYQHEPHRRQQHQHQRQQQNV